MRGRKYLFVLGAVILLSFLLGGCEKLKKQEKEDPGKTAGGKTYTGFEDITEGYSAKDVLQAGGLVCDQEKVEDGLENWDRFMESVKEKKPTSIRVMQKITEENVFYKDILYDGEGFRMIVSVDPEKYDYTYPYLEDLSGRRTEKSVESRLVILTDDKNVPFEDVIESEYESDEGRKANYQLIFRD